VNGELPTKLDGVSVNVGDQAAYVSYVSAAQINVLLPDVGLGDVPVTVTTPAGASTPVYVNSEQYGAAFFTWPNNQPVATHIDYTLAAKERHVHGHNHRSGQTRRSHHPVGHGVRSTTPTAPAGVPIPVSPVYNTASPVAVMIDNVPASV